MPKTPENCEHCPEHTATELRLDAIEKEFTTVKEVVQDNTLASSKLTTRVSMLIFLMSFGTLSVLGGAIYTFTAVSQFKSDYAEHRIEFLSQVHDSQQDTVTKLSEKMEGMERRLDKRMDIMSTKIAKLEATVESKN